MTYNTYNLQWLLNKVERKENVKYLLFWGENCFDIVCEGNYHKFSQHEDLKEFLLNTKDRVLVEASPVDNIWGIGMDHDHAENPRLWKGSNLLGFALMEVKNRLKKDEK